MENSELENAQNNEEELRLDDLQIVEASSGFDSSVFEGQRIPIAKVEIKEVIDKYPNGEYNSESTEKKKVVEITTATLKEAHKKVDDGNVTFGPEEVLFPQEDGSTKPLVVTHRFNLQKKEGNWVISKHPKAALWKFMRKMEVESAKDLLNKIVTITTTPSKNAEDEKRYLSIVVV